MNVRGQPPIEEPQQPNVTTLELPAAVWVAIVLTGAGSGLAGGLLMRLLRLVQHLSYGYEAGDFLFGVDRVSGVHRLAVLTLAAAVAAVCLFTIRRLPGAPGGSLSTSVWSRSGEMPTLRTVAKSLLSIVTVGMGVALGREGALKDTGGVIGNSLADSLRLISSQRQLLVACGAGAGMAAAYNVPLGGALFAAEVLLGSLTLSTVLPAFVASFTGVAVSWLLLPDQPAYSFPELASSLPLLGWSLLAGLGMGVISVGYVRAITWARTHKPEGWQVVALPLLVITGLGLVSMRFPEVLGNGKNVVQLCLSDRLGAALLACLIVLRPLSAVLCLGSGTPGGLFTPTMTFGALLGDGFGHIWNHLAPAVSIPACALIGSAALLSAATLGPLSSAVFLLELTRHADSLMVPLLLATSSATITARRFEVRSIYSE